jgi:hypothetical protein
VSCSSKTDFVSAAIRYSAERITLVSIVGRNSETVECTAYRLPFRRACNVKAQSKVTVKLMLGLFSSHLRASGRRSAQHPRYQQQGG